MMIGSTMGLVSALVAGLALASPAPAAIAPVLGTADAVDTASYAKPLEARVTHVSLDLTVDFRTRSLGGTATLDIAARPGADTIVLDDKRLRIERVTTPDGRPLAFAVGKDDPTFGAPLTVRIGAARRIVVHYRSAPDAGALQWLTPAQTAGKKRPLLFSQGESIENRSWIPTQDSPGIRQSWDAHVTVPSTLVAVMSAPAWTAPDPTPAPNGMKSFGYRMVHPVAPYLIALAVGDLAHRDLGPRTGVWAEPATLGKAAREFADTEQMVAAAERLYGPYDWGRYDMLVLPPSFPFGGMENPNLTFLTPTIIAGDKSLVSVVAHELAHSWSGNLATNATWNDFWLNEGMTTYAERRIVEAVYGKKVARQQVALAIDALDAAIADNGGASSPDTRLHLDLQGRSPDDGLTDIAYEKGAAFLRMIEANVGRSRFDTWLKGWFDRHRFQPVTSAMFLADIRRNLVKGNPALEARLQLDRWVYQPGIPANAVPADPAAFAAVDRAVAAYGTGVQPSAATWAKWDTDERLRFLGRIAPRQSPAALTRLDRAFGLSRSGNAEIRFAFLKLAATNRDDAALPALDDFLGSVGRGKFVKPLYQALAADKAWGLPIARRIYARYRASYHPLVSRDIDRMGLAGDLPTDKI
ncbi:M1 family metallopeptidase [Sphingomonas sp. ASV193]|uniref:M1 family metallopeptidase n=1 Tax=Sphingomonas sp. ASV193 TaxID=3144405 RepID=UPI0032E86733